MKSNLTIPKHLIDILEKEVVEKETD